MRAAIDHRWSEFLVCAASIMIVLQQYIRTASALHTSPPGKEVELTYILSIARSTNYGRIKLRHKTANRKIVAATTVRGGHVDTSAATLVQLYSSTLPPIGHGAETSVKTNILL